MAMGARQQVLLPTEGRYPLPDPAIPLQNTSPLDPTAGRRLLPVSHPPSVHRVHAAGTDSRGRRPSCFSHAGPSVKFTRKSPFCCSRRPLSIPRPQDPSPGLPVAEPPHRLPPPILITADSYPVNIVPPPILLTGTVPTVHGRVRSQPLPPQSELLLLRPNLHISSTWEKLQLTTTKTASGCWRMKWWERWDRWGRERTNGGRGREGWRRGGRSRQLE
ncbi:hypothetical protein KSP39_PZI006796 [Platanthera zijinensis]|uniref:Uncharacterized protein n=1 Tax=Platanthera zijinensis TaxID=2320716 RepID=A0AAP0BQ30_9ASPA